MNQQTPNQTRTIYIIVAVVAVVVVLALVGSAVYLYSTRTKPSSNSSTSMSGSKNESSIETTSVPLTSTNLAGIYNGTGSVLSTALNFPQTMIEFKPDKTFVLNGGGLSLSLLADPALQINGIYPTAKLVAIGTYKTVDSKNMDISVSSIVLNFFVNDQPLPAENQVQLVSAVAKAGFTIPTATETSPLIIPAIVELADSQITIKNTDLSTVIINFVGKKV